jgi:hypothetical protein
MTTSTMITITTMVPMPINMGFLSMRTGLAGRSWVYLAGQALGALAVVPGRAGVRRQFLAGCSGGRPADAGTCERPARQRYL